LRYIIDKAYDYTNKALKIYHKHPLETEVDPYIFYNAHLFTERNHAPTFDIKLKYIDSLSYFINKRYPYDNVKKSRLLISIAAIDFDKGAQIDNIKIKDKSVALYHINEALKYYNQALLINEKLIGFNNSNSAFLNSLKGLAFYYKKDYVTAIKSFDEGINRLLFFKKERNIYSTNPTILIDLLTYKVWSLDKMYEMNKDIKFLYQIDMTLSLCEKIWINYSNELINNEKQYFTLGYLAPPFTDFINNYYKLNQITPCKKYINKLFEYSEKSKYMALLENKIKNTSHNISKIDKSKLAILYEELLLNKNNKIENHISTLEIKNKFLKQYFKFKNAINQNTIFKNNYIVKLKDFQKSISQNSALISYVNSGGMGNNSLYGIVITKTQFKILNLGLIKGFDEKMKFNENVIKGLCNNDVRLFVNSSKYYYQKYFYPLEKILPNEIKHLSIVPNSAFENFNFDLLVTKTPKKYAFNELSYLGKKYDINYLLSVSISNHDSNKNSINNDRTIILPSFNYNKGLTNLNFSLIEKKSDSYGFKSLTNKQASRRLFFKKIKENKCVILFSHGKSSTSYDENSKGFYLSDGFMNINDLYKIKSNCELIIIGACESNVGYDSPQNHEGNINLARAFTAIGVKSMMLASWKIDEKSSAQIITSFLKYLDDGCTKSEALQKAKLDYLATASPRMANPLYWAGLNITGNNETIQLRNRNYWWWGLVLLPMIGGGVYYRKKRKKRTS